MILFYDRRLDVIIFMRKILFLFISFFIISTFHVCALDSYVYDNAGIISSDTESYIELYSEFLKEAEDIDYVVYTIKNSENLTLEEYTDYLYSKLEISEKGLFILVSKEDRSLRVKTGNLLGKTIPGKVIDEYIERYFLPSLSNNDWDDGIKNGYSSFYKLLCNYYEIDSSDMMVYDSDSFLVKYKDMILLFEVFLSYFLGHVLCKYFNRVLENKSQHAVFDHVILIGAVCLNILSFVFAFNFMKNLIWILMGFELVSIISEYQSIKKYEKKKRKVS